MLNTTDNNMQLAIKNKFILKPGDSTPIFLLGNQKSGTTAIAALLAEATDLSVTLDFTRAINSPGDKILIRYGLKCFSDYIYNYSKEFSRKIIKEPGLTFNYYDLKKHFPNAKFIMIVREPKDNIRSILNRLKIPGNIYEYKPSDWPEIVKSPAWRLNLDSSWLGHQPENHIDSLAYRWRLSAKTYLDNSENFILVRYEDFLANKKAYIEDLAKKLKLNIVNDITKNLDKQFQPKGVAVYNYDTYYGEKNLNLISRHCKEFLGNLGYKNKTRD